MKADPDPGFPRSMVIVPELATGEERSAVRAMGLEEAHQLVLGVPVLECLAAGLIDLSAWMIAEC